MFWFPLCAVPIWSGNAIVSKLAAGTNPVLLRFIAGSSLGCWSPCLWHDHQGVNATSQAAHLRKLMLLALLGMVLNQSLGYYAAQSISAVNIGIHNARSRCRP